jgi:recombination protein RecA
MNSLARADLESLLRIRKLDSTLTSALPSDAVRDTFTVAATDVTPLDALLSGGFPRGQLSEIIGARSSGRTSLLLRALSAATARGELVALVDALDAFDVESACAARIELDRLLWIRGHVVANPGLCHDLNQRAVDQAIKALTLVLQAGNFGLVVFDVAEAPREGIRRLPFTTWLRLQRMVEGTQTACVLVGTEPMARSSAGLTLRLGSPNSLKLNSLNPSRCPPSDSSLSRSSSSTNSRWSGRLFSGLDVQIQLVRARTRVPSEASVSIPAVVSTHV